MTVSNDLIDQLLAGYKKPEDLIGENRLLKIQPYPSDFDNLVCYDDVSFFH